MRNINDEEMEKIVKKLTIFIGDNINNFLNERILLLNNMRVFLTTEDLQKKSSQIKKKQLISIGTVLGKFTKTGHFKITITGMRELSKYGLHKVWLQENGENNFLYGNNALKNHIHKISDNIPINGGVFVYNKNNTLLGFGLMAVNQHSYQKAKSGDIIVLCQADNGEYIRNEIGIC